MTLDTCIYCCDLMLHSPSIVSDEILNNYIKGFNEVIIIELTLVGTCVHVQYQVHVVGTCVHVQYQVHVVGTCTCTISGTCSRYMCTCRISVHHSKLTNTDTNN